jgi:hypothetical protein
MKDVYFVFSLPKKRPNGLSMLHSSLTAVQTTSLYFALPRVGIKAKRFLQLYLDYIACIICS